MGVGVLDAFNKKVLLERLQKLQPPARAAFAAAIATRMLTTHHQAISGESKQLSTALECAWEFIMTQRRPIADCRNQLDILIREIQKGSENANKLWLYEEDRIAAVAYTLRAIISEEPEEPTWAAQRMFETVGRYLRSKKQFSEKGPELLKEIHNEPLMQTEFSRQFEDLDGLKEWSLEAGLRVRKRAEENHALPSDYV